MPRGDIRIPLSPPLLGIRSDLPKHLVPDGFMVDGSNVLARNGVLIVRPGMSDITAAPSANRVMGGIDYRDNTNTQRTVAATTASLHSYDGTNWSAITGATTPTGGEGAQWRFAVFPFSTTTRLIAVNDTDVPQVWTGSGNFADLGGSPPIARTATTAFQRVILGNVTVSGTRRGSSLWVSGFQDPTSWAAANQVDLPDTGDVIVEVQSLNTQAFAIYKDMSQWVGIGAGNIFPFIFELRGQQPGPVSPASVVRVEDAHYYVGNDGNVYKFDGNRVEAIGSHIRSLIYNDLDWGNKAQTHGVYDPANREIWWFWPRYATLLSGGIVYRLPYGDVPGAFSSLMRYGVTATASFPWEDRGGVTWNDLTAYTWDMASFATTYPTWQSFPVTRALSLIVGGSDGSAWRFNQQGGDDGLAIDAVWELPMRPISGDGYVAQIDVIESFFKNTVSATSASVIAVTSDTLGDSGTQASPQTVQLSSSGTKLRASYENTTGRFFGVRYRIASATALNEFRGGTVYAYRRQEGT